MFQSKLKSVAQLILVILFLAICAIASNAQATDLPVVKVGVLQFGTVNWELDVVREHKLDEANGIKIEVVKLGNKNATSLALQGGEVDVIVSDWIWVSRQRSSGKSYVFSAYSNAVGGLLVHPDSGIESLQDLKGKKLGIAGGPVDKSWILYRAYVKKRFGFDLADEVEAQFAAPPLLNKVMMKGELDAVITFWKFGAKLSAAGMKALPSVPEILPEFGVDTSMPLLGWVFSSEWSDANPESAKALLKASYAAKSILSESDQEWDRLKTVIKPKNDAELSSFKTTYRAGVPKRFGSAEIAGAATIFKVLAETGGKKLVGKSVALAPGTFWQEFELNE